MEQKEFDDWVQGYLKAWKSNKREDIEALFTDDATYLTQAFRAPWRGRQAIVDNWLERADWQQTWNFEYKWLAVEGNTGVMEGLTSYHDQNESYCNIWTIRLAEDGRCKEFREYWIRKSNVEGAI